MTDYIEEVEYSEAQKLKTFLDELFSLSTVAFRNVDLTRNRLNTVALSWGALEEDMTNIRNIYAQLKSDISTLRRWCRDASNIVYMPNETEYAKLTEIATRTEENIHAAFDLLSDIIIETPNFYGDPVTENQMRIARQAIENLESRIQMEFAVD